MLALFPWFVLRWAQMWLETKENNEQLREELEVAKEELSNTKKKLEEALVVCTHIFTICINKVLNRFTRFPATLQRFSLQDRYHLLFQPHWIKKQKRENFVWYFNHTDSDNNSERFFQGELARAQRQQRLEREKLNEKLEAVEAQMQVQTTLGPRDIYLSFCGLFRDN